VVHREPRLDGIPAVVAFDEVVDVAEVPARREAPPCLGLVAMLGVRLDEARAMTLRFVVDLTRAQHVRQRAAERREIGVRLHAEAADTPRQRPADERIGLVLAREAVPLRRRRRGHITDPPLADDLLRPALFTAPWCRTDTSAAAVVL